MKFHCIRVYFNNIFNLLICTSCLYPECDILIGQTVSVPFSSQVLVMAMYVCGSVGRIFALWSLASLSLWYVSE